MEIETILDKLGFTKNETKVYLAMLRIGAAKAGKISKEARVNRTCCYDALKSLIDKGLISYVVEANRKVFQAESPMMLLQFLKHQQDDVEKAMPQLEGLYKLPKAENNIRLFKGLKGIKTVFMDMLKNNEPIYYFGSEGQLKQRMPYFCPHFVAENKRRHRKIRLIRRFGTGANPEANTEWRWVPKDIRSNVVTNIYGDRIAIIIWTENPEAVIIHNKEAADSYRNYFEFMWQNAIIPSTQKSEKTEQKKKGK